MLNEKIIKFLDLSGAVCVKPSEQNSFSAERIKKKLATFPKLEKNTLIVVNDQYRATPCAMVVKYLRELGKIKYPLAFIIATGSHESPSKEEGARLTDAKDYDKIIYHDVYSQKEYSYGGVTSRGTEVYYNPVLDDFDNVITIGSVEPHYFAGFTGGAKSLMPGIAAKKTITQNHRWATDPNSGPMKTRGNPVFEDIWESANLIKPLDNISTVQIVNYGDTILHMSVGRMREAFEDAKIKSEEFFGKKFNKKFGRIITFVQPPLDKNLYQSQKAANNIKNVLKDGGSLVLVAECSLGVGTKSFFDKLTKLGSAENVIKELSFDKYELGDHKALGLASLALKASLYYVGNLAEKTVATAYFKKLSISSFAETYNKWIADGDSVLVDEAGGFTTCYFDENQED